VGSRGLVGGMTVRSPLRVLSARVTEYQAKTTVRLWTASEDGIEKATRVRVVAGTS